MSSEVFPIKRKNEQACKPGSVENGHLSWYIVTDVILRLPKRDGPPLMFAKKQNVFLSLASDGVYRALGVAVQAVSSYLTFPPLPASGRRFISVALSLGSPPPVVSRRPCPVKPGLSSPFFPMKHRRDRLAYSNSTVYYHKSRFWAISIEKFLILLGAYAKIQIQKGRPKRFVIEVF